MKVRDMSRIDLVSKNLSQMFLAIVAKEIIDKKLGHKVTNKSRKNRKNNKSDKNQKICYSCDFCDIC